MYRAPLLLIAVCLMLLFTLAVFADEVTLKNGDRLSGSVAISDGKTLVLKTDFEGEVTIQWDAITTIESSQNLTLTLKDGSRVSGKVTTEDGKFRIAPPNAPATSA